MTIWSASHVFVTLLQPEVNEKFYPATRSFEVPFDFSTDFPRVRPPLAWLKFRTFNIQSIPQSMTSKLKVKKKKKDNLDR